MKHLMCLMMGLCLVSPVLGSLKNSELDRLEWSLADEEQGLLSDYKENRANLAAKRKLRLMSRGIELLETLQREKNRDYMNILSQYDSVSARVCKQLNVSNGWGGGIGRCLVAELHKSGLVRVQRFTKLKGGYGAVLQATYSTDYEVFPSGVIELPTAEADLSSGIHIVRGVEFDWIDVEINNENDVAGTIIDGYEYSWGVGISFWETSGSILIGDNLYRGEKSLEFQLSDARTEDLTL